MPEGKVLRRDKQNAMIGGVCAGLADYFGFDITVTRIVYALLTVFTVFAGIPVYIILWILMPAKEPAPQPPAVIATPPPQ